jgi:hypothetical protein
MLRCVRRKSTNGGHTANINERPIETRCTANQSTSNTAAPAGNPGYTDEQVGPFSDRAQFEKAMLRLIALFTSAVLSGATIALAAENDSSLENCSSDKMMTFEGWAEWTKVTPKPVVSAGHSNNWVGIYVDKLAESTYLSASSPYPECARIVKPIYWDASGTGVRKLTIMVKMPPGYDSENADWWYGVYDASGTKMRRQGKLTDCIPCHKQAAETDYLFSKEVIHGKTE